MGITVKIKREPGIFTSILIFLIFKIFPERYKLFDNFIVSRE